jgi:hypothetical protein
MKGAYRWLLIFSVSLLAAKLIEVFLTSRAGRRLMEQTGSTVLLSDEGLDVVRRYSKEATEVVLDTIFNRRTHRENTAHTAVRDGGWANVFEDFAYAVSGMGSLMRVAVDFLRERQELRSRRNL